MDKNTSLLRYLSRAVKFPEIIETGETWISAESEQKSVKYAVVPLSVRQILFNTGIDNREELESRLASLQVPFSIVTKDVTDGSGKISDFPIEVLVITDDAKLHNLEIPVLEYEDGRSVRDLFKFTLNAECIEHLNTHGSVMKIEDAVFGIKNVISIADDFMPHEIMGMVEGKFPSNPEEFVDQNRIGNGQVFILMKETPEGLKGFHSILPAFTLAGSNSTFDNFMSRLKEEVSNLESSDFYDEFQLSRLLKTLIFQLKTRNRRELKGPLLAESSIKLLQSADIIEREGDTVKVKESIKHEDLEAIRTGIDGKISSFVSKWLNSPFKGS